MKAGMICYDADNKILCDTNISTTRILGKFNTGTTANSITLPILQEGEKYWVAINYINDIKDLTSYRMVYLYPHISIDDNIISWNYDSKGFRPMLANRWFDVKIGCECIYGIVK